MKTKLLFITAALMAFSFQAFAQPVNDVFSGAIPITPAADGSGCTSSFSLPFSTDGTTDSGVQGSCRASGLDQFFTWTATKLGLNFYSQNPGNPGIVVYNSTGTIEIACTNTFDNETIGGWNIGDDLVIQIYDFEGTGLSDVAFCLESTDNAPVPTPITFTSSTSGSSGSYRIACVDMNGDFLDDLVSISSNNVNIREQNNGGGFTTKNIATTNADFEPSWSLAAADYNRDGYTDLLYGAGNGVTFMRSDGTGNGFTEVSGSEDVFSQRSNFIDINQDGHLDAFVCHDVAPNVYYINDGSGNLTFNQGGLGDYSSGGNYGSIWIDYDNDRDLDLFIAKCGGETARRTNQMHTNDGNGNYTENAAAIGLADPMQTWSSAWGDFDNDGDMDVFVGASSGSHKMMRNDGGTFVDISAGTGVDLLSLTSTETVTYDFDNDGNLDLVSGGNLLFGDGNMNFTVHTGVFPGAGAYGDLNNDGYIDAFNSSNIYLNNKETNNNWIKIHTVGTTSNINGIGARVEIYTDSGVQIRDVKSGDGFRYMSSMNTHFGIGSDTSISHITIYWPNSGGETFLNPPINQPFNAVEGTGFRCVVSPIAYLEGAALNPNSGENNLMRDDLRLNGWLASNATTSPYADALIADPSVFNTTGDDAIVDWVFVELRDKNDNSIVIDSQSALLQRDGDVVGVDGLSALGFDQDQDDYFIAIKHRNHLGVMSATTHALSPSKSIIDFASNPNTVEGDNNAVVALANGKYGMYTGDFDGNEQVQNSDASGVIQLIGGSGYNNADMDANAQIQNSDVNTLINPNIGRGQQFQRSGESNEDQLESNLTLTFANAQITNDGSDNFYEADILIASTEDFYVGSGQVYFEYNTAAFGGNISSNGAIEYSQPTGSILEGNFATLPAYKDFVQNDNTASRVSLSFQQNFSESFIASNIPNIQITATPKVLFHIKIKYVNAGQDADVCFYNDGVFQDQFYTACGGAGAPDCTGNPGVQITDDTYDCAAAGVTTLDIASYESNSFKLYPNPVKNTLYIKGNTENLTKIEIININGQLIKTINAHFNQIDVSHLNAAIYFLKVYAKNNTSTLKLIKQ
ncbi:FG-GAP-like repeat-containing protein [Psychroserpens ponticola]|uniref:FG-GAP-like repeat-containing protein n=1 Tax=Psychroserpens ponticola TaxID=2932268 RepID=A0ABY7RYE2_9FLAO|nr:FG-GAP-like repeat-containing protein [Psychroserpens ponticola]WCO01772.1 FG-GAP-like repeat-containing protein [Psychroserpens ponticola]